MTSTQEAEAYTAAAMDQEEEISTWIHRDIMERYLVIRGWTLREAGGWLPPDKRYVYWEIDEAFRVAVTLEVLYTPRP